MHKYILEIYHRIKGGFVQGSAAFGRNLMPPNVAFENRRFPVIYHRMHVLFEWLTFRTKSDKDSDQCDIEFEEPNDETTILLYT